MNDAQENPFSLAAKLRAAGYAEPVTQKPTSEENAARVQLVGRPNPAGSALAVYLILLVFFVGAFALASIPLLVLMFLIKAII
jgi:hypothetical protein